MTLASRRVVTILLRLLGLVLIGTVCFLALVRSYFHVDSSLYIVNTELGTWDEIRADKRASVLDGAQAASADEVPPEKIPRIIHQTWKTDVLPSRWADVRKVCAEMMPDYEYMLWTDESSRKFIEDEYPWFLETFDSYPYNIQRADAIRYFVLHKYGGVYMDLDIGCKRRLDSLLRFEAIVPRTIPVGVSNDLMFSVAGHPYMELLIHSLAKFNHYYFTHYATVMFSTGPMFVSALFRTFSVEHRGVKPSTPDLPDRGFQGVRVLPKSLYGKNLPPEEAPDSFFEHLYGSSWHANDAGFMLFLRIYGRYIILAGALVVLIGLRRTLYAPMASVSRGLYAVGQAFWMRVAPPSRAPAFTSEWIGLRPTPEDDEAKEALVSSRALSSDLPRCPPVPMFEMTPASQEIPTISYKPSSSSTSSLPREAHDLRRMSSDQSSLDLLTPTDVGTPNAQAQAQGASHGSSLPTFFIEPMHKRNSIDNGDMALLDTASRPSSDEEAGSWKRVRDASSQVSENLKALFPSMKRQPFATRPAPPTRTMSLTSVGVEGPTALSRTLSNQSEDDRREWANLVGRWDTNLRSPMLVPSLSPSPTLIEAMDTTRSTPHMTEVQRRPPGMPHRALTPGVPVPSDTDSIL